MQFAQAPNQNSVFPDKADFMTNGYNVSLRVCSDLEVVVNAYRDIGVTGLPIQRVKLLGGPPYLVPTNWFCGFIALVDNNATKMPMLKPEVNLTNAYPNTLDWQLLLNDSNRFSGPVLGSNGLFDSRDADTQGEICIIHLKEVYNLTNKGDYKLTVWPKIYKRTETNDDIYRRIDLAPVSTIVHVN